VGTAVGPGVEVDAAVATGVDVAATCASDRELAITPLKHTAAETAAVSSKRRMNK
jgi:hypothetical protein